MPGRNTLKEYVEESYYHVYNRGVAKQTIFHDERDYSVFLSLLKRYLNDVPASDFAGRTYEWLHPRLELLSFCLMPNHFHLLVYQEDKDAMQRLMRGVCTSYTQYYNRRYKRVGPLFQSRYKASRITTDAYLLHITRYIHLNPREYKTWEFSSLPYFLNDKQAGWVRPRRILELFEGTSYKSFVEDYAEYETLLDITKQELASY